MQTDNPNELIYLCEDDYLHRLSCDEAMKIIFRDNYQGFYAPYDYPDRYTVDTRDCELHAWQLWTFKVFLARLLL